MKQKLLCLCVFLLSSPWLCAQDDKTGAPFFIVQGKDSIAVSFPLTHVATDVQIVGVIADVTIRQVYQNKSPQTLEAVYVFPASTKAAVYAMQMQVGKKRIKAQIKERRQILKNYKKSTASHQQCITQIFCGSKRRRHRGSGCNGYYGYSNFLSQTRDA